MDKCIYCGSEDKLHIYGQTDPGMSHDLTTPQNIYACNSCDPPPVNMKQLQEMNAYAEFLKGL